MGRTTVNASATGFSSHRVHTREDGTLRADWEFVFHWGRMPERIVERVDGQEPSFTIRVTATAKRNAQPDAGNFLECAQVHARGFLAIPDHGIQFADQWRGLRDGEAMTAEGEWQFWIGPQVGDAFPVTFSLCRDAEIARFTYRRAKEMAPAPTATAADTDAELIAKNEARYREQDEREGAHEFYAPEEGMRRLPGTADPRFFCHDFAWRPEERRRMPPDPGDVGFSHGHVNPDLIVANPAAFGFVEITDLSALQPGDIACYLNGDDRNHIDHSGLIVRVEGGVLLHSKDVRNSIFEHRLGEPGERNFFRDRYGANGIRFFRRK